jgi:hypothetical protein
MAQVFSYSQIWLNLALDSSPLWLHHNIDNNNKKNNLILKRKKTPLLTG